MAEQEKFEKVEGPGDDHTSCRERRAQRHATRQAGGLDWVACFLGELRPFSFFS